MELTRSIALAELTAMAEGDLANSAEARFSSLVARQSRFVFRVAYAVLRNAHDAEDVVQDVFLKLYRTHAWRNMDDERAYLARVAWRLAVDRLPRRRDGPPAAVSAPSHEQRIVEQDLEAIVHRLIDALPEDLRQPLALSAIDGMNSRQIAEAMGIPEGTVRTRLLRARRILKEKLAAYTEVRHD